uniref:VP11 n=1 Tax=viral metagenome TaxID=1070528 RepID=A0A6C0BC94_9ZZZZ
MSTKYVIPKSIKDKIVDEIIIPFIESDIKYNINTRTFWSTCELSCKILSPIIIMVASILSFLSRNNPTYSDYAGIVGIISASVSLFGYMCNAQDHIKVLQVNSILESLGIDIKIQDEPDSLSKNENRNFSNV